MKPISKLLCLASLAGVVAGSAVAQQAPKPEALIKWRQSAFQVVAWNSGRIKASLDGGYNQDQVLRSANVIAAIASSGLSSLFPAGTETGKGWHDTTIKGEAFANPARFAELGGEFARESAELVRVAVVGEVRLHQPVQALEFACVGDGGVRLAGVDVLLHVDAVLVDGAHPHVEVEHARGAAGRGKRDERDRGERRAGARRGSHIGQSFL